MMMTSRYIIIEFEKLDDLYELFVYFLFFGLESEMERNVRKFWKNVQIFKSHFLKKIVGPNSRILNLKFTTQCS